MPGISPALDHGIPGTAFHADIPAGVSIIPGTAPATPQAFVSSVAPPLFCEIDQKRSGKIMELKRLVKKK